MDVGAIVATVTLAKAIVEQTVFPLLTESTCLRSPDTSGYTLSEVPHLHYYCNKTQLPYNHLYHSLNYRSC